jgi:hypothetical protein
MNRLLRTENEISLAKLGELIGSIAHSFDALPAGAKKPEAD